LRVWLVSAEGVDHALCLGSWCGEGWMRKVAVAVDCIRKIEYISGLNAGCGHMYSKNRIHFSVFGDLSQLYSKFHTYLRVWWATSSIIYEKPNTFRGLMPVTGKCIRKTEYISTFSAILANCIRNFIHICVFGGQ
jgi:hypothetical protein